MSLPNETSALVAFIITCSLACALTLFLIVRIVYRRGPRRSTVLEWLQTYSAFTLLFVAALVALTYVAFVAGFIAFFVMLVILVMAYNQCLATQRLALLELIALAAERQLPLSTALTGYGYERGGPYGWRAVHMAQQLEAGQTLSSVLVDRRSFLQKYLRIFTPWRFFTLRTHARILPRAAQLAASVGEETGELGEALRELATRDAFQAPAWHASMGRFLYLSWFTLAFAPSILVFLAVKIGPQLQKIFDDFGSELPTMTAIVLGIGGNRTFITVMMISMIAGNIWVLVLAAAYMFGLQISLPGTGWFTRGLHRSVVLRALALGARARRTLPEILGVLIANYPAASVRRRLHAAQGSMNAGVPWTDSLRGQGLIGQADAAVLTSAQRVGNLPWALEEMAESNERRLNYQLQTLVQIAFPVCVLVIGMVVAFCVVGYFLPLVKLITDLSA